MSPASTTARNIVVPVAFTSDDDRTIAFVTDSLYRKGDAIHLVHVLRTREPGNEIYHGPVGTSVDVHDPLERQLEAQAISKAQQDVKERYTQQMTDKAIEHNLHLFVHATNADGSDVFQTVNSVCEKVSAEMLVMSAVHQGLLDAVNGRSVHTHALEHAASRALVFV
eukprot:jgi/Ulvmu1/6000/UM026_0126.1